MNIVSAIIAKKHKILLRRVLLVLLAFIGLMGNRSQGQGRVIASTNSYYQGLLFTGTPFLVDSLQSEELLLEGVKEKILGNMVLAADYFKQSIGADPHNDASLYELSLIALHNQDFIKAKEYIERALEVKPNEGFFLMVLLEVGRGLKDKEGMEKCFNRLIQLDPNKSENYNGKAELYLEWGKTQEAVNTLDTYEKKTGDFAFGELQKEKIYLSQNKPEKALESMKVLLERYPENTRYYLLISEIYRSLGKSDKAWENLKKVQNISPEDGFVRLGIFEYYAASGRIKEADSSLEKTFLSDEISVDQKAKILEDYYLKQNLGAPQMAIQLSERLHIENPENSVVTKVWNAIQLKAVSQEGNNRKKLADFLEKEVGDYKTWIKLIGLDYEARDFKAVVYHSGKAIELYPNQIILYWYLANSYKIQSKYIQAKEVVRQGLLIAAGEKDKESLLLSELGEIYHSNQNMKASDSAFLESLKRNTNPMVLNNFAYYLALRNNNLEKADSMSNLANTLEPGNANFEDTFAWILYKEKKLVKSKIWIEKAIKDDSTSAPTFWDHYGDILYENGEKDKALEAWKKALGLGSSNPALNIKITRKHP